MRIGDGIAKLVIGNLALWCTRDVEGLVWEVGEVAPKALDHSSIAIATRMLNIEIKAVNLVVLERTGEAIILAGGAEGIPQKIGKPFRNLLGGNILISCLTTKRQHHCFPKLLTDGNIFPYLVAATEKLSAFVNVAIALISKIGARPISHGFGKDVDEPNIDDIKRSLLTEVT